MVAQQPDVAGPGYGLIGVRCSAAVQAARYRAARRALMRSAHCEIRPGENVTLQSLSHHSRPAPPRRASRRHRAARRHRTLAYWKFESISLQRRVSNELFLTLGGGVAAPEGRAGAPTRADARRSGRRAPG